MNSVLCRLAAVVSLLLALGWQSLNGVPSSASIENLRGLVALSDLSMHSSQQAFASIADQLACFVDALQNSQISAEISSAS